MNEVIHCGGIVGDLTITGTTISTRYKTYELKSVSTLAIRDSRLARFLAFLCLSAALITLGNIFWLPLGASKSFASPAGYAFGLAGFVGFLYFFWISSTRHTVEALLEPSGSTYLLKWPVTLPQARAIVAAFARAKAQSTKSGA